jgi:hypothetical protein
MTFDNAFIGLLAVANAALFVWLIIEISNVADERGEVAEQRATFDTCNKILSDAIIRDMYVYSGNQIRVEREYFNVTKREQTESGTIIIEAEHGDRKASLMVYR